MQLVSTDRVSGQYYGGYEKQIPVVPKSDCVELKLEHCIPGLSTSSDNGVIVVALVWYNAAMMCGLLMTPRGVTVLSMYIHITLVRLTRQACSLF